MKWLYFSILFLFLSVSLTNAQETERKSQFGIKITSVYKNLRYKSFASEEKINNSPCWDGKENPPISFELVIKTAEKELKELLEDYKIFGLEKVGLQPLEGFNETCQKWLYSVHFEPKYLNYVGPKQNIIILVLMDGTVIRPEVEEINSLSKQK